MEGRRIDMRFVAGVLLSIVLMGWFLSGLDWPGLVEAFTHVHWGWVVAACCSILMEFVFRTLRWRALLRKVDPDVPLERLLSALLIGAAANTLLPLRGGDVVRPMLVARERKVPFTTIFSTTIMERVFDILGVVTTLVAMLLIIPAEVTSDAEVVANLRWWGMAFGGFALGCLAIFFALATGERAARATFHRIVSIAPAPVAGRFMALFDGFVAGLGSTRHLSQLAPAFLWTLGLWTNGIVAILCTLQAFSLDLPAASAFFVQVAIALSVALPQAPGFLGVFQVVIEEAMTLWGAELGEAQAVAMVFWAESFLPVTTVGLFTLWREGHSLLHLREEVGQDVEEQVAEVVAQDVESP